MDQDDRASDPLLRAIGEMRRELLGWIDERIERLRQGQADEEAVPAAKPVGQVAREARAAEPVMPVVAEDARAADHAGDDARARLDQLARQLGARLRHAEPPRGEPG